LLQVLQIIVQYDCRDVVETMRNGGFSAAAMYDECKERFQLARRGMQNKVIVFGMMSPLVLYLSS
jgi:hypothetical protein